MSTQGISSVEERDRWSRCALDAYFPGRIVRASFVFSVPVS